MSASLDIEAVRIARIANSAPTLIDALTGADLAGALQQVGSALLVVHADSGPADRALLERHLIGARTRLGARDWEGDDVLADELLAAIGGEVATPVIDLDEVVTATQGVHGDTGAYVNTVTGQTWPRVLREVIVAGDDGWVDVESEEWIYLAGDETRDHFRDMVSFAHAQTPADRTRLARELEGRGAFSRFRRAIGDLDLEAPWRIWSDDRAWGRMRAELAWQGIKARVSTVIEE